MTHKIGMLCITAVFTLYEHNFILLEMVPPVVMQKSEKETLKITTFCHFIGLKAKVCPNRHNQ